MFRGLLIFLFFFIPAVLVAQVTGNEMNLRYHSQLRAGVYYISNSILDSRGAGNQNEIAPLGKANNNDYEMRYIDIDGIDETFNSSSATMSVPDCSSVEFAALYWGGCFNPSNKDNSTVKLRTPWSSSYLDLSADKAWDGQYFKDITSLFRSRPSINGTFTIANLACQEKMKNIHGGWTIVVVYKNNLLPIRDVSIFDGLKGVGQNTSLSFKIGGFSAPPSGPVDISFGFVAYDGDRSATGDFLKFNNEPIYDGLHDANNLFNSTISNEGNLSSGRNPSYSNTLGYDAAVIHLDNSHFKYLKNSGTEAAITLGTNSDGYSIGLLSTVIDIYNPFCQLSHSFNNLSSPGKSVLSSNELGELIYTITNAGNDYSEGTVFLDTIPTILEYVAGSMALSSDGKNWKPATDVKDDDQADYMQDRRCLAVRLGEYATNNVGGAIRPGGVLYIKYKVTPTSDEDQIRCFSGEVSKFGWLAYSGRVNSGWHQKIHSDPVNNGHDCVLEKPLTISLEKTLPPIDTSINVYCSGTPVSDLRLPFGYALYNLDDITFQHPLDNLGEPGVYKAYRKLSTGCEYSFNVIARADSVTIYSQPDNIEATVGSGVAFSVGVKGENVSFQWQVNKGSGNWEDIQGATERSLTIPKVTEEMDGYNYRLRVTTPCKDYLLSVKVVLSVKKQPVSKPSEEPEPQPEVQDQNVGALFVPNAFMPASNTQELRSFVVKGHGLAKWQMTIFNKWDQVIWKTDLIGTDGSPAEGWDGKMFGADAPQGAYMWAIEAVFEDGKEWEGMSVRDSKPRKSGVVYLLR